MHNILYNVTLSLFWAWYFFCLWNEHNYKYNKTHILWQKETLMYR